jgi:gamma-glutamyltranspeptidase/glutathione hydrolase
VSIFRDGGNAIDAALAAAAALTVVYPHQCSIGGDVMALVARPGGELMALNGSGAAAYACSPETLRRHSREMPLRGPMPITVPGAVGAWQSLARMARLPMAIALAPAITFAAEGVPVASSLDRALGELPELQSDPGFSSTFSNNGESLTEGDLLRQPALARSLQSIAADGSSALYGGELGKRLIEGLNTLGSPLSLEDLEHHETEVTSPLARTYRDVEVITTPPNSQGFVLLEILAALSYLDEVPDPLGEHAPILAQICRLASRDRDRYLADPRHADVPLTEILSERHGADLLDRARAVLEAGIDNRTEAAIPKGDTVAVVTADNEGNAASLIQSIFHTFGSGILEPDTGILMHNRGASFDLNPRSPNALLGAKRPLHTLMPVLLRRGNELIGVHGAMGGKAQPQILLQLLLRTLRSESAAGALAAPRWVVGGLEEGEPIDVLQVERSAGEALVKDLARTGMPVVVLEDRDEEAGHGQLINRSATGEIDAGTDPRADGSASIIFR